MVLDKGDRMMYNKVVENLIEAVKAHALANYDKGDGWDIVVECYSDAEIAKYITGCKTARGAITKIGKRVKDISDYGDDIRATAW